MRQSGSVRTGVLLGIGAVVAWSTSSAFAVYIGGRLGPWQFLALICGFGFIFQAGCYRLMGKPLRRLLLPPLKLWPVAIGLFGGYTLVYTAGIVFAVSQSQKATVNLVNYLWAMLTVLFAVLLVPGVKMTWRLSLALVLAIGGLALARGSTVLGWFSGGGAGEAALPTLPYVLGAMAAVTWGLYSALLSRWRGWARDYATAPLGLLSVSVFCFILCAAQGHWAPMDAHMWFIVLLGAIIPETAGYLFWELALHRAPASTLGLLGSVTPIFSTALLLGLFAAVPSLAKQDIASPPALLAGAALIGVAVVIGSRRPRRRGGDATRTEGIRPL